MSILLEALKLKNSKEQLTVQSAVPANQPNPPNSPKVSNELSLTPHLQAGQAVEVDEPMEVLVSRLDIQPPSGLNWQLSAVPSDASRSEQTASTTQSASDDQSNSISTAATSLPPLSLDLILPNRQDNEVTMSRADHQVAQPVVTPTPQPDTPELSLKVEHALEVASPAWSENAINVVSEPASAHATPDPAMEKQIDQVVISVEPPSLTSTELEGSPRLTLPPNEPPLKVVQPPQVDKSPLSAQRFLAFARRMKPTVTTKEATHQDAVKLSARAHKPRNQPARKSFLVAGSVVAGLGVLGYATLTIWESQQAAHLQQMARYKSQNLTDLPERPVVGSTPPLQVTESAAIVPATVPASTGAEGMTKTQVASSIPVAVNTTDVKEATQVAHKKGVKTSESQANIIPLDTNRRIRQPSVAKEAEALELRQTQPTAEWLMMAYQAWQQGDREKAAYYYRQVLEKQPKQRDALLGMLAISQLDAVTSGLARDYAEQLRRLYPNDREVRLATDGVLASVSGERLSESELKQSRQNSTNPGEISFRLGLLYAEQQRWSEAQSAFFEALSTSPANTDYRLNLAVSYDHLGKHRLAVEHYQQVLSLAKLTPISQVDTQMIEQRLAYLAPFVMQEP